MEMDFPVYLNLGFIKLHPHPVFELLAYFIGFRVYLHTRQKGRLPTNLAVWVVVGATLGAALGSKLLFWLEDPMATLANWNDPVYMMGGKTIVGGLLGGLIGVELMKKRIGVTRSTGDDFVLPLIVGMILGRIGCFLTGLDDHTHGTPTSWPTAIDFGDGIPRHPTQLYEIVWLLVTGAVLITVKRRMQTHSWSWPEGALFQLFMLSYLSFRFAVDFIKPTIHPYWIFNNIQLAALAGMVYYLRLISRWNRNAPMKPEGGYHAEK